MDTKFGVKETIEVLSFGFDLSEAIQVAKANDGKVDWKDAGSFIGLVVGSLPKAISGIQNVPSELSELSDEERFEIVTYFSDRFDLKQDKLEELIEKTLKLMLELTEVVAGYVEYSKTGKSSKDVVAISKFPND